MSLLRPRSLRWRLALRIAITQSAILVVLSTISLGFVSYLWVSGSIVDGVYELSTVDALTKAVKRDDKGRLVLQPTAELARLRREIPDFWFVLRDLQGNQLAEGTPPANIAPFMPSVDFFMDARLGHKTALQMPATAVVRWVDTPAGEVQMVTNGQGRVSLLQVLEKSLPAYQQTLHLMVLMTLATILVTPLVVRRALRSLGQAATETSKIDIDQSGTRLSAEGIPLEILPFVQAVNDALERLDKGYEGHKRFLTDAAHELRTPIAILTTRLSALPAGPLKNRLLEDASRLTALAGQLLDLQRLDRSSVSFTAVDIAALAERVVLDMAPLAFNAGYEMSFEPEADAVWVKGDPMAIERALTNLLQNAISYGGRQGSITVRVFRQGWLEVSDEGKGIPEKDLAQVFEPFHRLKQDGRGAGLGLDLVQKIMRLHNGSVQVVPGQAKGACFRLSFALLAVPAPN